MSWGGLLFILAALSVGYVVGLLIGEWDNHRVARRPLGHDLWLSASEAQADIAADVRRAEEQIRQVSQPSEHGGSGCSACLSAK